MFLSLLLLLRWTRNHHEFLTEKTTALALRIEGMLATFQSAGWYLKSHTQQRTFLYLSLFYI